MVIHGYLSLSLSKREVKRTSEDKGDTFMTPLFGSKLKKKFADSTSLIRQYPVFACSLIR